MCCLLLVMALAAAGFYLLWVIGGGVLVGSLVGLLLGLQVCCLACFDLIWFGVLAGYCKFVMGFRPWLYLVAFGFLSFC